MKKLILLFSVLSLVACGSDDSPATVDENNNPNNPNNPDNSLTANVWKTVSYTNNGQTYEFTDCYNSTGNMALDMFVAYDFNNQFNEDNEVLRYSTCNPNLQTTGEFTFNNNVLTLNFDGDVWTADVTPMPDNHVRFDFTSSSQGTDVDGISVVLVKTTNEQVNEELPEEITGTWTLTDKSFEGVEVALSECEMESFLTFQATSQFTGAMSAMVEGNCVADGFAGQWFPQNDINFVLSTNGLEGSNSIRLLSNTTLRLSLEDSWTGEVTDYIYTRQ